MSDLSPERIAPERPPSPSPVPPSEPMQVALDVSPNMPVLGTGLQPGIAAPPVAAQRTSHVNASKLESEKVVVAAPMSLAGSAARIWKLTGMHDNPAARIGLGAAAICLILCAWMIVLSWYLTFGLLVVPYRVIRRGQRKNKRQALMHREQLAAMQSLQR